MAGLNALLFVDNREFSRLNSALVVLLPKRPDTSTPADYRPITIIGDGKKTLFWTDNYSVSLGSQSNAVWWIRNQEQDEQTKDSGKTPPGRQVTLPLFSLCVGEYKVPNWQHSTLTSSLNTRVYNSPTDYKE
jgi:hypothetical protein